MSKFPFGSIIQDEDGAKRKVLGECGDMRFLSSVLNHCRYASASSVADFEDLGYTEVKAPWKPEELSKYAFVFLCSTGAYKGTAYWSDSDDTDHNRLSCGNVYNPDDDSCDRAVERVNKALKGE